jgi:hypothetical protein
MSLILGPRSTADHAALARLRNSVRELWRLSDDDSLVVTELACKDPDCPERETVIVVARAGRPVEQHKLPLSATDVTREHLDDLVSKEPTA